MPHAKANGIPRALVVGYLELEVPRLGSTNDPPIDDAQSVAAE